MKGTYFKIRYHIMKGFLYGLCSHIIPALHLLRCFLKWNQSTCPCGGCRVILTEQGLFYHTVSRMTFNTRRLPRFFVRLPSTWPQLATHYFRCVRCKCSWQSMYMLEQTPEMMKNIFSLDVQLRTDNTLMTIHSCCHLERFSGDKSGLHHGSCGIFSHSVVKQYSLTYIYNTIASNNSVILSRLTGLRTSTTQHTQWFTPSTVEGSVDPSAAVLRNLTEARLHSTRSDISLLTH